MDASRSAARLRRVMLILAATTALAARAAAAGPPEWTTSLPREAGWLYASGAGESPRSAYRDALAQVAGFIFVNVRVDLSEHMTEDDVEFDDRIRLRGMHDLEGAEVIDQTADRGAHHCLVRISRADAERARRRFEARWSAARESARQALENPGADTFQRHADALNRLEGFEFDPLYQTARAGLMTELAGMRVDIRTAGGALVTASPHALLLNGRPFSGEIMLTGADALGAAVSIDPRPFTSRVADEDLRLEIERILSAKEIRLDPDADSGCIRATGPLADLATEILTRRGICVSEDGGLTFETAWTHTPASLYGARTVQYAYALRLRRGGQTLTARHGSGSLYRRDPQAQLLYDEFNLQAGAMLSEIGFAASRAPASTITKESY